MGWIIYVVVAVMISGIVGWHISRFQDAYDETAGMLAGVAMGLLNAAVIAYGGGAATGSLFWANLLGTGLGVLLGIYYGRAGGLRGVLAGGVGGLLGGAIGALLSIGVRATDEQVLWTGVLLGAIYVLGMYALVGIIEQATPEYAAYHRLPPLFARPGEALEDDEPQEDEAPEPAPPVPPPATPAGRPRRVVDYYAFLGVHPRASGDEIWDAYEARIEEADEPTVRRAEQALAVLTDAAQRRAYDRALAENRAALAAASPAAPAQATTPPQAATPPTPPRQGGRR